MKKENFLKKRTTILGFAFAALLGGFLFLSPNITGSTILDLSSSYDIFSLIGFLLIICSVVLAVYLLKKK